MMYVPKTLSSTSLTRSGLQYIYEFIISFMFELIQTKL